MSTYSILEYVEEKTIRGDLARELHGIINDYNDGQISVEDKEALVEEILRAYQASELAKDEVMWRWAVNAATIVAGL
jgi:hypothetical protein